MQVNIPAPWSVWDLFFKLSLNYQLIRFIGDHGYSRLRTLNGLKAMAISSVTFIYTTNYVLLSCVINYSSLSLSLIYIYIYIII